MKKGLSILILIFLMAPIRSHAGEPDGRLLAVRGTSEIQVVPNEFVISLGVVTIDNNIDVAKRNNDRKAAEIIDVAMRHGVSEKDIKTQYLRISPNYRYDNKIQSITGYTVQNNMSLRSDDIRNVQVLIGAIIEAGGNIAKGVDFRKSEIERYRERALVEAIKSANEKAKLVAKETGVRLGKVRKIEEEPLNIHYPRPMVAGAALRESGTGSSIAPGQIEVSASVSVVYDIE